MITTDSKELADLCRIYRNHGGDGRNFYHNASNHRMTEISACIGITQLNEVESFIKDRNRIALSYCNHMSDIKNIRLLPTYENIFNCYWNFYFVLDGDVNREDFKSKLLKHGIQTGDAYSPPCHEQKAFNSYVNPNQDFSVTERVLKRHVSLPMYVGLAEDDIEFIIAKIKEILE